MDIIYLMNDTDLNHLLRHQMRGTTTYSISCARWQTNSSTSSWVRFPLPCIANFKLFCLTSDREGLGKPV